jgi:hypothetical protein
MLRKAKRPEPNWCRYQRGVGRSGQRLSVLTTWHCCRGEAQGLLRGKFWDIEARHV